VFRCVKLGNLLHTLSWSRDQWPEKEDHSTWPHWGAVKDDPQVWRRADS